MWFRSSAILGHFAGSGIAVNPEGGQFNSQVMYLVWMQLSVCIGFLATSKLDLCNGVDFRTAPPAKPHRNGTKAYITKFIVSGCSAGMECVGALGKGGKRWCQEREGGQEPPVVLRSGEET